MENKELKEKQADEFGKTVDEFENALTLNGKTDTTDTDAIDFGK